MTGAARLARLVAPIVASLFGAWSDTAIARQTIAVVKEPIPYIFRSCRAARLPKTFGAMEGAHVASRAETLVPPRDYTQHDDLTGSMGGDPKASGNYDIALLDIDRETTTLELRDYGYGDLSRPQTSRILTFPVKYRTIRIRQLTIDLLASTSASITYHVTVDQAAHVEQVVEPNKCQNGVFPVVETHSAG